MELTLLLIETLIFFIFAFTMGFLMILAPEKLWELQHRLSVKGGEPSEFYLVSSRIMGVAIVIGLLIFAIFLIGEFGPLLIS